MGSYIHNIATTLLGQFGITFQDCVGCRGLGLSQTYGPDILYARHSGAIKTELRKMKPETVGRIAFQGKGWDGEVECPMDTTPLSSVHEGRPYLNQRLDGRTLVMEIACTAIVAEMMDILWARRREQRAWLASF